ncbi:DUF3558 domain-containing protein [Actinokineospora inagensis]|uniref:DUF3558 domain-containing protein n=1 Tax=Actinokineospora inagensis TaxID=103730 RepID=UPI001FE0C51E|nr:DUF3558 domain-containing protein [Actinokineospora inagensis]
MLAGCTTQTTGTPSPQDTGTAPTSTSATETSGTPAAAVRPCELITDSTAAQLGITGAPAKGPIHGVDSCRWRVRKADAGTSYTIDVAYYPKLGLADLVADGQPTPISLGRHKAVQAFGPDGLGCVVSIEVTAKSRVDVSVLGGDPSTLCAPAKNAAQLVEPLLPPS